MAVPKQKQSHSRTNKRRSTAQDLRAGDQPVPARATSRAARTGCARTAARTPGARSCRCTTTITTTTTRSRRARRPVCPYRPPLRDRLACAAMAADAQPLTIALDALGADAGPAEVARGAALAAAARRRARDRVRARRRDRAGAPGSRSSTRRCRSPRRPIPARAVRVTREASIVQAVRAVADGRADALVSGGSTGAALAAGLFHVKRGRGIHRPALAVLVPVPGQAVPAARLRRQRRGPARAPRPVRAHGRGVHGDGDGDRAPARGAALQRDRADEGDRGRPGRARAAGRGARPRASPATSRASRSGPARPT